MKSFVGHDGDGRVDFEEFVAFSKDAEDRKGAR